MFRYCVVLFWLISKRSEVKKFDPPDASFDSASYQFKFWWKKRIYLILTIFFSIAVCGCFLYHWKVLFHSLPLNMDVEKWSFSHRKMQSLGTAFFRAIFQWKNTITRGKIFPLQWWKRGKQNSFTEKNTCMKLIHTQIRNITFFPFIWTLT